MPDTTPSEAERQVFKLWAPCEGWVLVTTAQEPGLATAEVLRDLARLIELQCQHREEQGYG